MKFEFEFERLAQLYINELKRENKLLAHIAEGVLSAFLEWYKDEH